MWCVEQLAKPPSLARLNSVDIAFLARNRDHSRCQVFRTLQRGILTLNTYTRAHKVHRPYANSIRHKGTLQSLVVSEVSNFNNSNKVIKVITREIRSLFRGEKWSRPLLKCTQLAEPVFHVLNKQNDRMCKSRLRTLNSKYVCLLGLYWREWSINHSHARALV